MSVLIFRYLVGRSKRGFHPCGEWISFKETDGGKLFWPNFSNRAIKPLVECFQQDPNGMIKILVENLGGRMVDGGDVAIEVETFPGVFVKILFWIGDPKAVDPLIQALKDENCKVRWFAARALGLIGDPKAVDPLIQVFKDENSSRNPRSIYTTIEVQGLRVNR